MKGGYPVKKVVRAAGEYLYLQDGSQLIDGISSWWVNIHGHSHPELAEAIYEQAKNLEHVIFSGFTHQPAESLAERLCEILPHQSEKIFFSDNGSTAVEVALKMGVQMLYNQGAEKIRIIALEGAYHGDTFGAMAVGARDVFTSPFQPLLFDVDFLPFPDKMNEEKALERLENLLNDQIPSLFIYEPLVQGASGMRMYSAVWLEKALERCQSKDCLTLADEVFTGFGRTGKLFASSHLKPQPDIICLSKAVTGGILPLGLTAANRKIVSAFEHQPFSSAFLHGHSFTANPIVVAAANKSLEILERPETKMRMEWLCKKQAAFRDVLLERGIGENPRVLGTLLAVEAAGGVGDGYFNSLRNEIYHHFIQHQVLLRPLGRTIYTVPPYSITEEALESIYKAIIAWFSR
jgi:adenosylmethionine-8-amino-7-oxononanoate aminotransferase